MHVVMSFTAHNIMLPDGTQTLPSVPLVEDFGTFGAVRRMLRLVFPEGLEGKSIVDLGCLEGGVTTGFARLGMEATGIEIRESNLVNCHYVQSKFNFPNLHFIKDDVNNIDKYGPFDVIYAGGILYHLDRPRAFLEKASAQCRKVIFIDTHFTCEQRNSAADHYKLSDLCENDEGLMGRWFSEHDSSPGTAELETQKWASWNNKRSFWIQREYLIKLINEVGFDMVLEQYDLWDDNILAGMQYCYNGLNRGLFVGVRSA
jgi:SAM-dependent methyltransferase